MSDTGTTEDSGVILSGDKRELMKNDFTMFARFAFNVVQPGVSFETNWHIECIGEHFEAMIRGEIPRMVLNLPPRSLKSFLGSMALPAYLLGHNPSERIINTSYGGTVVEQNAVGCRKIMDWADYKAMFPKTIIKGIDRIQHFETSLGGRYYADTALSTITGIGCNWMIIDDPIKPMEAMSETVRRSTNENIRSTLLNRFDDPRIARLLLIMQRTHEDDPTGNLLKDGGYYHLKLPGETKTRIHYHLKHPVKDFDWEMSEGGLLFPKRLSRAALDQMRLDMTPLHYAGQVLQEPVPIGGGEFRADWPQTYDPSGAIFPRRMNVVILCDPAGGDELNKKKKKRSDFTVFDVNGLGTDNNYFWLDGIRDRLNPTERVDMLFILHRKWNALCGKPPKVGYEHYGMQSDIHYIKKKMKEEGYYFPIIPLGKAEGISDIKEERIRCLIPDLQQGRWYFPPNLLYVDKEGRRFDLVHELIQSEMMTFPSGRFDDMLDAKSRIYHPALNMVFPKLEAKDKPNIIRMGEAEQTGRSWLDF